MSNPKQIRVCCGRVCRESGNERLLEVLANAFHTTVGNPKAEVDLDRCECTGYCEQGPNVVADNKIYHDAKANTIVERIEKGDGVELKELTIEDLHLDDDLLM